MPLYTLRNNQCICIPSWVQADQCLPLVDRLSNQGVLIIAWKHSSDKMCASLRMHVCTAGDDYPMLTGNLVAIFSSGIICTVISLIKPDSYDWQTTREIPMVDDTDTGAHLLLFSFTHPSPPSHDEVPCFRTLPDSSSHPQGCHGIFYFGVQSMLTCGSVLSTHLWCTSSAVKRHVC